MNTPQTQMVLNDNIIFAVLLFNELEATINLQGNDMFKTESGMKLLNKLRDAVTFTGGKNRGPLPRATTVKHQGRIVYAGPRGGKYIKVKGQFQRLVVANAK